MHTPVHCTRNNSPWHAPIKDQYTNDIAFYIVAYYQHTRAHSELNFLKICI